MDEPNRKTKLRKNKNVKSKQLSLIHLQYLLKIKSIIYSTTFTHTTAILQQSRLNIDYTNNESFSVFSRFHYYLENDNCCPQGRDTPK